MAALDATPESVATATAALTTQIVLAATPQSIAAIIANLRERGPIGYDIQTGWSFPVAVNRATALIYVESETDHGGEIFGKIPGSLMYSSGPAQIFVDVPVVRSVAGTVTVAGNGTAGYTVRVFRRDFGTLLAETVSGVGGAWTVVIDSYNGELTVIAYDLAGGVLYNAQIFDQVIPV